GRRRGQAKASHGAHAPRPGGRTLAGAGRDLGELPARRRQRVGVPCVAQLVWLRSHRSTRSAARSIGRVTAGGLGAALGGLSAPAGTVARCTPTAARATSIVTGCQDSTSSSLE